MKKIILDTDIGPDCDDAAALALALIYARQGLVDLLAVMHCTSSPWGVGAIRAICDWYDLDLPVGTLKDKDLLTGQASYETYNKPLAQSIAPDRHQAEDASRLYRRLLAASRPESVELVAIGPWRNLANLLRSGPDEISPLDGRQLVLAKVRRLTAMAGAFAGEAGVYGKDYNQEAEWNIAMDIPAARFVMATWPTSILFCGFGAGLLVQSGGAMQKGLPSNHPVRLAYQYHNQGRDRASWDLLTVMHVLDESRLGLGCSPAGQVTIDAAGVSSFKEAEPGRHAFLKLARPPAGLGRQLDQILLSGG